MNTMYKTGFDDFKMGSPDQSSLPLRGHDEAARLVAQKEKTNA